MRPTDTHDSWGGGLMERRRIIRSGRRYESRMEPAVRGADDRKRDQPLLLINLSGSWLRRCLPKVRAQLSASSAIPDGW